MLRQEAKEKDERYAALQEELHRAREFTAKHNTETSTGGYNQSYDSGKSSQNRSLLEKLEISKKHKDAVSIIDTEGGLDSGEVARLKVKIKNLEDEKELISLEKEQMEIELKAKKGDIELWSSKSHTANRHSSDIQEQYRSGINQFRELNKRMSSLVSYFPGPQELVQFVSRIQELTKENEKVALTF